MSEARTIERASSAAARSSGRNPSSRDQSPMKGGFGSCAWSPQGARRRDDADRLAREQQLPRERRAVELPRRQRLVRQRYPAKVRTGLPAHAGPAAEQRAAGRVRAGRAVPRARS